MLFSCQPESTGLAAQIDPGFFALFLKTTPGLEAVALLLTHDFQDADRILKTMAAEMNEIYPSA